MNAFLFDREMYYGDLTRRIKYEYNQFVLWTGGLDSTCLLIMLATSMKTINPMRKINAVYIKSKLMDPSLQENEEVARERILEYAKDTLGLDNINPVVLNYDMSSTDYRSIYYTEIGKIEGSYGADRLGYQYLSMMPLLAMLQQDSQIFCGYVNGDRFIRKHEVFTSLLHNAGKILGIDISLEIPLVEVAKYNLINYAKEIGFYDFVWYCDNAYGKTGEPCGKCHSCLTMQSNEIIYNEIKKLDDEATDTTDDDSDYMNPGTPEKVDTVSSGETHEDSKTVTVKLEDACKSTTVIGG